LISNAFRRRLRRVAARHLFRSNVQISNPISLVSFSFDDFPVSAYIEGGKILQEYGVHGTYFVAGSLEESSSDVGDMFTSDHLQDCIRDGHEIGCHTFHHFSSDEVTNTQFERSVDRNSEWISKYLDGKKPLVFAYPFGRATLSAKSIVKSRFYASRGVEAGTNGPVVDLHYLKANALYGDINTLTAKKSIDDAVASIKEGNRWCIFYTHDVSPNPSPYGCTPDLLEYTVEEVLKAEIKVRTMGDSLKSLGILRP
jgi:peptidoglycan/xylan/chitin deacetylase (PgdA/CDA1 family)